MKLSAIVSTVLFLGATQLVGAEETLTSTLTTTVTRTLIRVNAVSPTTTPTHSSTPVIPTSHAVSSSTLVPTSTATTTVTNTPADPEHTNMAAGFEGNMPVALAGGALALILGAL
ncbi:hypothetical protein BJY01DRAFT_255007 [Aspergillus pseudoustus]|uniref:GPI anchored protein n=1 Tax=Aspergillus pseudoustus TaxID=1810923 RepID=A0ABR4INY7_9EURO